MSWEEMWHENQSIVVFPEYILAAYFTAIVLPDMNTLLFMTALFC